MIGRSDNAVGQVSAAFNALALTVEDELHHLHLAADLLDLAQEQALDIDPAGLKTRLNKISLLIDAYLREATDATERVRAEIRAQKGVISPARGITPFYPCQRL